MITWSKTVENKTSVDGESKKTVVQVKSTVAWGNVTGTPTTIAGYGITDAYTKVESDAAYEPIFSKNTAFNKNFGTTGTTVAYGNHVHSGFTQDSANEVISGIWTFTGVAEFGVAPQFTAATGSPFTVAATATTVVTNLNADMLDGSHASAFSLSSHNHTGVYEPFDADITKRNEAETISGNWTFSATHLFDSSSVVDFDTVPGFNNPVLPFTVHSNANLVTNLNADLVDGKHSNELGQWTSSGGFTYLNTVSDLVGIGTPSPDTILHLQGSDPVFTLESTSIYSTIPSSEINSRFKYNVSSAITNFGKIVFSKNNATDGDTGGFTAFYKKPNGATASEAMRIDPDGKIGINKTIPTFTLDVNGSVNGTNLVENGLNINTLYEPKDADITKRNEVEAVTAAWNFSGVPYFSNAILPFSVNATAGNVVNLDADKLDGLHASSFARMNQTSTGYFHATANTTTAAIRARQDGTGYIMDWYDGASLKGYFTQAGLLVSDDYKSLSDERLKDKFKKVKNGLMLDKVLEISKLIRTYERLDKNNELELGWGAQTLYKIAPEYVHKPDNKEDTWAVGYGKMVVPLYAAVSTINDRLKKVEKKLKL